MIFFGQFFRFILDSWSTHVLYEENMGKALFG